jgi:glycosyltransferase involved in cell wall biosynthesis
MTRKRQVVLLASIPGPYRERVHERAAELLGPDHDYTVVYMARVESNRQWDIDAGNYRSRFLRSRVVSIGDRYIHINRDVTAVLDELDPDVVITTSFQPTCLLAFAWCMRRRRHHVAFSDGWMYTEAALSWLHRALRRYVYARTRAFIGGSHRTLEVYRHYGVSEQQLFVSCLAIDNTAYERALATPKRFDIMFSGRIAEGKMPDFFVDVARELKRAKPDLRVLVVGDGPDRERMLRALDEHSIEYEYAGFLTQRELPPRYASARLLVFPTRSDAWGLVANEACAAGTPVITCEQAGVAGELVQHGVNGFVLELDAATWARHAHDLLSDSDRYARFRRESIARVQPYNYESAAAGIADAVRYCSGELRVRTPGPINSTGIG